MKQRLLSEQVYIELSEASNLKPSTAKSFRKLIEYLESNKPISKYLLEKFTILGIYDPKERILNCEASMYDIVLKAMVFDGLLKAKCPQGRIRSLEDYKEQKILQKLLVSDKEAKRIHAQIDKGSISSAEAQD